MEVVQSWWGRAREDNSRADWAVASKAYFKTKQNKTMREDDGDNREEHGLRVKETWVESKAIYLLCKLGRTT